MVKVTIAEGIAAAEVVLFLLAAWFFISLVETLISTILRHKISMKIIKSENESEKYTIKLGTAWSFERLFIVMLSVAAICIAFCMTFCGTFLK